VNCKKKEKKESSIAKQNTSGYNSVTIKRIIKLNVFYAVISLQPLSVKACLFNFTSRLLILAQPKWMPHFL